MKLEVTEIGQARDSLLRRRHPKISFADVLDVLHDVKVVEAKVHTLEARRGSSDEGFLQQVAAAYAVRSAARNVARSGATNYDGGKSNVDCPARILPLPCPILYLLPEYPLHCRGLREGQRLARTR